MNNILKLYQQVFGAGSPEAREAEYFPPENREPRWTQLASALSESQSRVAIDHYIDGKKQLWISKELGVSRQNTNELLHSAVDKLKSGPETLRYFLIPSVRFMEMFRHLIDENIDLKKRLELQELVINGLKDEVPIRLESSGINRLLELEVKKLGLSRRSYNILARHGAKNVRAMLSLEPKELKKFRGIGPKSYGEIIDKAKEIVSVYPELEGKTNILKGP